MRKRLPLKWADSKNMFFVVAETPSVGLPMTPAMHIPASSASQIIKSETSSDTLIFSPNSFFFKDKKDVPVGKFLTVMDAPPILS